MLLCFLYNLPLSPLLLLWDPHPHTDSPSKQTIPTLLSGRPAHSHFSGSLICQQPEAMTAALEIWLLVLWPGIGSPEIIASLSILLSFLLVGAIPS